MKNLIPVLFILFSFRVMSQEDTNLSKLLTKSIVSCEIVAFNSQEVITSLSPADKDSIRKVLRFWEKSCSWSEPVQRLFLLLDIAGGTFSDSAYLDYYRDGIPQFKWRNRNVSSMYDEYEHYKQYYDYVPINGSYDQWTRKLAAELRPLQSPGSLSQVLCVLLAGDLETFEHLSKQHQRLVKTSGEEHAAGYRRSANGSAFLSFSTGLWVPVGNLARSMIPSAMVSAGFNYYDEMRNNRFELGFTMIPLATKSQFNINIHNRETPVKSSEWGFISLKHGRTLLKEESWSISSEAWCGLAIIGTDYERRRTKSDTSYYNLNAPLLSAGMEFDWRLWKRTFMGIGLHYVFSPFVIDRKTMAGFGSSSFLFAIILRPSLEPS